MNKKLFVKVKDLCKDTGLSEKYLKAITEKMGGSIEDDSTDDAAIEETANLIADVAKESQGEATRWANKKKADKKKKTSDEDVDPDDDPDEDENNDQKKKKPADDPNNERIKELEKKLADMEAENSKGKRAKEIADAMEKHKIPAKLRNRLSKSISDDEDPDEAIANLKQDLITDGLMTENEEGSKAASEKQVDEAADDLLKSITAK